MFIECAKCDDPFEGRSNRRYCSTACKSSVNNDRQLEKKAEQIKTNKVLNRNRRIMIKLHDVFGSEPIEKKFILKSGLEAEFNTGSHGGKFYFYEYVLSYDKEKKDIFFITKN